MNHVISLDLATTSYIKKRQFRVTFLFTIVDTSVYVEARILRNTIRRQVGIYIQCPCFS